ncbi:MAG: hypothetical protein V3V08_04450 [Nannocystaceae bacterium]
MRSNPLWEGLKGRLTLVDHAYDDLSTPAWAALETRIAKLLRV